MYGVLVKYRGQMDPNREMFPRRKCLHIRVAVTVNSLLEPEKVRQSYEVTKHYKFQTVEKGDLGTKCGNLGRGGIRPSVLIRWETNTG